MFFRRTAPKQVTFEDRLNNVRQNGFATAQQGHGVRVSRGDFAVDLAESNGQARVAGRSGLLVGGEIATLVDAGFQKFFRTPSGKTRPATAEQLMALHNFEEDLKEAFGEKSYFNEALGTVSTFYVYDRVKDRDRGVAKRPWE